MSELKEYYKLYVDICVKCGTEHTYMCTTPCPECGGNTFHKPWEKEEE